MRPLVILTAALLLTPAAQAGSLVVRVQGMDCAGCNGKLAGALEALPFLSGVHASFAEQGACAAVDGAVDEPAVAKAVADLGYAFVSAEAVDACPQALRGALPEPWAARSTGRDVQTISRGEEVDLEASLVVGCYTIFDFGASWCGPCHEAAERLAAYLDGHGDVAVRAIELGGEDPAASYQQPVVAQHLAYVDGVPWLIVRAPDGRKLIQTNSVDRALAAIDKHRARAAK